jgi:ABC-2 type transport system ATP-binding protein
MYSIEARGLVKTYPLPGKAPGKAQSGRLRALDGLNLSVPAGTVFALLGPNGAGKTTTVKILTSLATPDAGTATVEGIDVLASPARVRREIGVVAQRSGADPTATGRENLILQGHLYGLDTPTAKRRAAELLDHFQLADAARRFVRTYSGGMQRRLDVALGLMHRPKVLFLDEPTTGLDPESRTAMWQEIGRLAAVDKMTVLLTTHYLEEADRLADRVAIVDHGRVVAEGEPEQLKQELKGDVVQVDLADGADQRLAEKALGGIPAIRDVYVADGSVSARSDDGAAAVPAVLAKLAASGIRAKSVAVARPSLDEVYLRYAGRRYTEVNV